MDMLEAIQGVASHAKMYSWANYLADLLKTNCKKCQEKGTPIPSLTKSPLPSPTITHVPSLTKTAISSPTQTPQSAPTKIPPVDNKPSSTFDSSSKYKNPDTNRYKLKDIVKPDYIPSPQLVELSKAINQESIRRIQQFTQQEKDTQ